MGKCPLMNITGIEILEGTLNESNVRVPNLKWPSVECNTGSAMLPTFFSKIWLWCLMGVSKACSSSIHNLHGLLSFSTLFVASQLPLSLITVLTFHLKGSQLSSQEEMNIETLGTIVTFYCRPPAAVSKRPLFLWLFVVVVGVIASLFCFAELCVMGLCAYQRRATLLLLWKLLFFSFK